MTKPPIDLKGPMMLLDLGWGSKFIVPWTDGIQILNLMKHARFVATQWDATAGKELWRVSQGSVKAESFSPEAQAELLMNGGAG